MARKAKQTVITEQEIPVNPDDSPNVVAYRVGQLEKTMTDGFTALHNKLDLLRDGFVSHEQLAEAIKLGDQVHADHEKRLVKLEGWNTWLVRLVVGAVILAGVALLVGSHIKPIGG